MAGRDGKGMSTANRNRNTEPSTWDLYLLGKDTGDFGPLIARYARDWEISPNQVEIVLGKDGYHATNLAKA